MNWTPALWSAAERFDIGWEITPLCKFYESLLKNVKSEEQRGMFEGEADEHGGSIESKMAFIAYHRYTTPESRAHNLPSRRTRSIVSVPSFPLLVLVVD